MVEHWSPDIPPRMITDDIAFIGGTPVSVHCFIADEGLILLDTGYPGMFDGIIENMTALHLDSGKIRYIIHSHGHIDHYGNTAQWVRMTGARTLIGCEDASIVTGERELSWAKELHLEPAESFHPDILFGDGEIKNLCGREFRFIHAPGHTEGTYAVFTRTNIGGVSKVAAMHGGIGLNSMSRAFLTNNNLPFSLRDDFRNGLHGLQKEHVDVVLGNHPDQNHTAEKIAKMDRTADVFLDPTEWKCFLKQAESNLDRMLAKEKAI
jgi:metallo-beta-lactamase class B